MTLVTSARVGTRMVAGGALVLSNLPRRPPNFITSAEGGRTAAETELPIMLEQHCIPNTIS